MRPVEDISISTPLLKPAEPPATGESRQDHHGGLRAPSPSRRAERLGYLLMAFSALTYALSSVLTHFAQAAFGLSAATALLLRGTFQSALALTLFACAAPRALAAHMRLPARVYGLLGARALLGGLCLYLIYVGLALLPSGDAIAIFYTKPLFALAVGALLLGEGVSRADAAAAAVSLLGAVLVVAPWSRRHHDEQFGAAHGRHVAEAAGVVVFDPRLVGAAATVTAALVAGLSLTTVRFLVRDGAVHNLACVLAHGAGSTAVALAFGGADEARAAPRQAVACMAATALSACAGQIAMTQGLRLCRVGAASVVANMEVPFTYGLSTLAFGEHVGWMQAVGATLVVVGGAILASQKR